MITEKIVDSLLRGRQIQPEDRELYEFGVSQMLHFALDAASAAGIGLLWGMLPECIAFLAFYSPLRVYAGGFHAKTRLRCYFCSLAAVAFALQSVKWMAGKTIPETAVFFAAFLYIWRKAPKESRAKPLSDMEKSVFCARVRAILTAEAVILLFTLFLPGRWAACISSAVLVESGMILFMALPGTKQ